MALYLAVAWEYENEYEKEELSHINRKYLECKDGLPFKCSVSNYPYIMLTFKQWLSLITFESDYHCSTVL